MMGNEVTGPKILVKQIRVNKKTFKSKKKMLLDFCEIMNSEHYERYTDSE